MNELTLHAFLLTLIAGLSTGIGSCIALLARRTNRKFLSISLGFSAGVMVYVSMVEILSSAQSMAGAAGERAGGWLTAAGFFGGILLIALIDRLVPSEKPARSPARGARKHPARQADAGGRVHRARHRGAQLPRGAGDLRLRAAGAGRGGAHGGRDRHPQHPGGHRRLRADLLRHGLAFKAFRYSFLSGLSEPVGALVGWLILVPVINDVVFGMVFAGVAGIMVFISFDELLPAAREYGEHHLSIYGLIAGMAVMAVSLLVM